MTNDSSRSEPSWPGHACPESTPTLESAPSLCRRPLFAEKRRTCATVGMRQSGLFRGPRSGPGGRGASTGRERRSRHPPKRHWQPLNIPLPRATSERELQHGVGPAGYAVLLQTRFDRRLNGYPSGDLGGEEGCAADRASPVLEPPLGRDEEAELCEAAARQGSGEQHVQRMPVTGRRVPLTSAQGWVRQSR